MCGRSAAWLDSATLHSSCGGTGGSSMRWCCWSGVALRLGSSGAGCRSGTPSDEPFPHPSSSPLPWPLACDRRDVAASARPLASAASGTAPFCATEAVGRPIGLYQCMVVSGGEIGPGSALNYTTFTHPFRRLLPSVEAFNTTRGAGRAAAAGAFADASGLENDSYMCARRQV